MGWTYFTALAVACGSLIVRWLVVHRAAELESERRRELREVATRLGRAASLLLLPSLLLLGARQLLEFRDPFAPLGKDVSLLLSTPWGHAWLWTLGASALAGVGFLLAARGRHVGTLTAWAGLVVLAWFPGITGHAGGEDGGLRLVLLAADLLHVLGAGAWMGGLATVLVLERWWRRTQGRTSSALPHLVPAYSPVAVASVGTLVITGTLASWAHLPGLASLWQSGYGRILVLKLALVSLVMALGALNWRRITPKLSSEGGPAAMRRAAATELALGTAVLLVTAVLVRTSPLGH